MTRLTCLLAAFLFVAQAVAADNIHVITLKHRTAQELVPVVRPLLGSADTVSAMDYRLILRTSSARLADVERIVRQLDVAARSLTLTVSQGSRAETRDTSQGLSGEVDIGKHGRVTLPPNQTDDSRDGGGRATPGAVADDRGAVIDYQTSDARLRYRTRTQYGNANDNRTQMLRVQDGKPAYIRLGQSVPHVKRVIALSGRQPAVVQGVGYHDVVTGFEVLARVQGERVQLDITPHLSSLADPASGLANFQELRTTVNVRLGEWIDLGAIAGTGEHVRRAIVESAAADNNEQRSVWVKVE